MNRRAALIALTLALVPRGKATAHDLAETSATMVIRDGGQVELRLQVPWAEVLRDRWMRGAPMADFLARASSRPPVEFSTEFSAVVQEIERGTLVRRDGSRAVPMTRWRWPTALDVQAALRKELMSRLALGNRFEHESRLGASAEVRLDREPTTLQLELPPSLGPALLTVYRPTEQWLRPGAPSAPIRIPR